MEKTKETGFWLIIASVFFGNFVALLNSGTVTVALPFIMKELNADVNTAQWIVTGFMLAMGTVAPLVGYLGEKYSYKRLYIGCLLGLMVSSILCGVSTSIGTLILFRILQGIFSGAILPTTMTIIYQAVKKEKQAFGISLWSVASMFAPAVGPTVGGLLTEYYGWKALFFMNIPMTLVAIVISAFCLPLMRSEKSSSLDIPGLITVISGSLSLMMYFSKGGESGWFAGPNLLWLALGVISILLFIWRELTAKQPLLNIRVFKNSAFTFGTVVSCIMNIGLYAGAFLVPLFMENTLGSTSLTVGIAMFPGTVLMIVASLMAGRLQDKVRPVWFLLTGIILLGIATWAFSHLQVTTTYLFIVCWMIFRYIGLGLASPSITILSMSTVTKQDIGYASAISNWLRSVVASLAIGVFSSVYSARTKFHLANLGASAAKGLKGSIQQTATVMGMNDTFVIATFIIIVAIPFVLILGSRHRSAARRESVRG